MPSQRQVVRGEALAVAYDLLRLAQLLAAPHACFAAQRCGRLVDGLQLLPRRLSRRPQLAAGAAEGHGDARVEHVAQLAEDYALLVTAQRHVEAGASQPQPTDGLRHETGASQPQPADGLQEAVGHAAGCPAAAE